MVIATWEGWEKLGTICAVTRETGHFHLHLSPTYHHFVSHRIAGEERQARPRKQAGNARGYVDNRWLSTGGKGEEYTGCLSRKLTYFVKMRL